MCWNSVSGSFLTSGAETASSLDMKMFTTQNSNFGVSRAPRAMSELVGQPVTTDEHGDTVLRDGSGAVTNRSASHSALPLSHSREKDGGR